MNDQKLYDLIKEKVENECEARRVSMGQCSCILSAIREALDEHSENTQIEANKKRSHSIALGESK